MNNSFIFTQPVAPAKSPSASLEFKSSPKAEAPAQPFSNVLDRAVRTPSKPATQKPKQESLESGRGAEHRSARSVEAHEEHKPSAPPRGSKRKEKSEDETAMQSAVSAGMTAPVVKPIVSEESSPAIESAITACDCSAPQTSAVSVAGKIVTGETSSADSLLAGAVTLESLAGQEGNEAAAANKLAPDMKQIEQALNLNQDEEVSLTTDGAELSAEKSVATSFEKPQPTEATTVKPLEQLPELHASTAREVARGVTSKEVAQNATTEIVQAATSDDVVAVTPVVANSITADEAQRSARVDRSASVETREKSRGTAAAKMTMSMNNEANREEIAGLTQQVLPGGAVSQVATGINLPSESPSESQRTVGREISGVDALNAAARLTTGPARTDISVNGELVEMREASPAARLGEVISREVRMFKRGGDDLVEVVLTPDTKTQISLKIQWRDGQVEVQARCDMGDHGMLNTQWPQLQASFAAHGVRLSHLSERAHTGFTEFFNNSGFSQQRGNEQQPAPQRSAIDAMKPVVPTAKSGATRSVVRSSNRLESWA